MYRFIKTEPDNLPEYRHLICNLYTNEPDSKNHSLFIGQCMNLFGEADYITSSNEELCSWAVCAENEKGEKIYLEVYYGSSGPAIGGGDGEDYISAASELKEMIENAAANDFEISSVYEDLDITVTMGVKDGKPYYESQVPEDFDF